MLSESFAVALVAAGVDLVVQTPTGVQLSLADAVVALQVVVSAGANVVTRQTGAAAVLSSTRAMPVRVTLPVFVTR